MPDPRSSVPGHATHDELLVARLAGGDTLDVREHATASALVSSCPDCAALASDIVAISRAVAAESVPPRRRDFRISPEQAAELRGSSLQRLLRRFTLPTGGAALKPLASGALSIGLVLVFVGSVVPRPEAPSVTAPRTFPSGERGPAGDTFARASASAKAGTEESDTMGGEPPAAEPSGADGLTEASDTMALEMATGAAPEGTAGPASAPELAADAVAEAAPQSVERAMVAESPDRFAAQEADREAAPDERIATSADGPTDPSLDDSAAAVADADEGRIDIGRILMATGVALVGVGIVLG